jgi:hypothetical protein
MIVVLLAQRSKALKTYLSDSSVFLEFVDASDHIHHRILQNVGRKRFRIRIWKLWVKNQTERCQRLGCDGPGTKITQTPIQNPCFRSRHRTIRQIGWLVVSA